MATWCLNSPATSKKSDCRLGRKLLAFKDEDIFDTFAESSRDPEGQQQRWVVLAGFNRHDGMARRPGEFSQLFLSHFGGIEAQAVDVVADHLALTGHDTSGWRPPTSPSE